MFFVFNLRKYVRISEIKYLPEEILENGRERIQTTCLVILSVVAVAIALYWLRPVLVPFVLALFFFLIFQAMIDLHIKYLKIPVPAAVVSTIILSALFLFLVVTLISSSVGQMAANTSSYQAKLKQLLTGPAASFLQERWNIDVNQMAREGIDNIGKQAARLIGATANAVLGIVSQGVVVFIFFLFLILDSTKNKKNAGKIWKQSVEKIKKYIMAKFFISVLQGIIVGAILSAFRVDMALMFGFFAFLLNFIPTFGPILAGLLPLPVILVTPGMSAAGGFFAFILPSLVLFIIGNFIEPKAYGDVLRLRPIVILMGLIFWGMLWGGTGMFLAVPLTAVLAIILEGIETTKPIAGFMSGSQEK